MWREIGTVPRNGTFVLLAQGGMVGEARWVSEWVETWDQVDDDTKKRVVMESGYWESVSDDKCFYDPTHWMPLPTPPALRGEET